MKKRKKQSSDKIMPPEPNDAALRNKKRKPDPKNVQKLRKNVQLHQKPLIMRSPS